MIRFTCKNCGQKIKVADSAAGKCGKCPKCKNIITVPQLKPSTKPEEPLRLKRDAGPPIISDRPFYSPDLHQARHNASEETDYTTSAVTYDSTPPEEYKPATLLDMFSFPFSISGIIHLLIFWWVPAIIALLEIPFSFCCYGRLLIPATYILLTGYFYYFFANCVIAAAKDERSAPDLFLDTPPSCWDLVRRFFLMLTCFFICFGPPMLYALYLHTSSPIESAGWRNNNVVWLLYILGVFISPMLILTVTMFDSINAFNPFLIIGSIVSTLLPYCGLVLLLCVISLIMLLITYLSTGWALLSWGINVYLIFIVAYLLGRFYRRYEDKLNWEVEL